MSSRAPTLHASTTSQHNESDDMEKMNTQHSSVHRSPKSLPKPNEVPVSPIKEASQNARLSWQQRSRPSPGPGLSGPSPTEQGLSESREKPLSSHPEEGKGGDEPASKSQIMQSLSSKDPAWFRQTHDRGLGSAAYRKNRDEPNSENSSWTSSVKLPGMAADPGSASGRDQTSTPSKFGESLASMGDSTEKPASTERLQPMSPPPSTSISQRSYARSESSAQSNDKFDNLKSDTTSSTTSANTPSVGRSLAMSPAQGRLSPDKLERPLSPTKGLGGFVQSAMMKRSDSVNKRWSATAGPGLSRGNSIATGRTGLEGVRYPVGGATPLADFRNSESRESTPATGSRPSSSHTYDPGQGQKENQTPLLGGTMDGDGKRSISPEVPASRQPQATIGQPDSSFKSPPTSPGKRWSPSKASWLENAISKPDSPKVLSPSAPQQPAWMANINRVKQERASVDLSKNSDLDDLAKRGSAKSPPPNTRAKPFAFHNLEAKPAPNAPAASSSTGSSRTQLAQGDIGADHNHTQGSPAENKASPPPVLPKSPELSHRFESSEPATTKPGTSSTPTDLDREQSSAAANASPPHNVKSKPETPPKKDFRSSLKSSTAPGSSRASDEPEFKNVFGKLKKTQTQNYVAPNEFKDNIMRGKAGLNMTGGPKKSEVRDDFKDSILKKKQGMVTPSASTRITSASSKRPDSSVPEALAKRQGLNRAESKTGSSTHEEHAVTSSTASEGDIKSMDSSKPRLGQNFRRGAPTPKAAIGGDFASSLASVLQKSALPADARKETEASDDNLAETSALKTSSSSEQPSQSQLTHATKSRARGPRRKPPTKTKEDIGPSSPNRYPTMEKRDINANLNKPTSNLILSSLKIRNEDPPSESNSPRTVHGTFNANPEAGSPLRAGPSSPERMRKPSPVIRPKPTVEPTPPKPSESSPRSSSSIITPLSAFPERTQKMKSVNGRGLDQNKTDDAVKPTSEAVRERDSLPGMRHPPNPAKPPTNGTQKIIQPTDSISARQNSSKTNPPTGTKANVPAQATNTNKSKPTAHQNSPKSPKSPPLPGRKPRNIETKAPFETQLNKSPATPKMSPSKLVPESSRTFRDIFDEPPKSDVQIAYDTQAVIDAWFSNESQHKIKTLRKQMSEVTENGRMIAVPSQQEHILFEDSLYLCTHVFGTFSGTKMTEVYLWCGDGVSISAIEDAQIFGKRIARESSGRLIVLKQGKETSNFFQALGGIVITRRGPASRAGTPAGTFMLCGRRHLGQIAFDEVDCDSRNLCQGFPFLISGSDGRLSLWKGKGAGADELGCARLIGMDLGENGEIREIEESKEPHEFWSLFPSGVAGRSHLRGEIPPWHLKPSCEKYSTRLFTVNAEPQRPKSSSGFMSWGRRGSAPNPETGASYQANINEVTPFAQSDIEDDTIFVLDTFFEIFV